MLNEPLRVQVYPHSIRVEPGRLFPRGPRYDAAGVDELGLTELLAELDELSNAAHAAASVIALLDERNAWAATYPDTDEELWRQIINLMVSVDVTWSMLIASVVEVGGLLQYASDADVDRFERIASVVRATFLLEAAEQYAVSAGHQMTAVALRVCADDARARATLEASGKCKKEVAAISSAQDSLKAWPFHSWASDAATVLEGVEVPAVTCMAAAAELFRNADWAIMTDERGRWFHRFKSDFLMDTDNGSATASARLDALLSAMRAASGALRDFVPAVRACSPALEFEGRDRHLIPEVTTWDLDDDPPTPHRDLR